MHKFTILTVLLSIVTISIVADIIMNGYSLPKDYIPAQDESIVVEGAPAILKNTDKEPSPVETSEARAVRTAPANNNDAPSSEVSADAIVGAVFPLTSAQLVTAGVPRGVVKETAPRDLMLQVIPLPDHLKKGLGIANLFDFEEYLGTMYALNFENAKDASGAYSDLKALSITLPDVEIRETNTFGESSFYLNQTGKTKTAFSLVLIGSRVYGFEYPHGSHQLFKDLSAMLRTASTTTPVNNI